MIWYTFQVFVLLIRSALAAVLVASGAAKLSDIRSFVMTLAGLGLPAHRPYVLRGLAISIPLLEIGVGIVAVTGLWATIINGILLVLMCSFSLIVMIALQKKVNISCRCFGALSDSQFNGKGLVRNLLLTVLALIVFLSGSASSSQIGGALGTTMLLVAGYLVFGIATTQAAKSLAAIKERMAS